MLIETEEYTDAITAAKMLGLTRATISYQCKVNRFPGQVRIGHFWAIPIDAIKNYTRQKPGKKKNSDNVESEPKRKRATREELMAFVHAPGDGYDYVDFRRQHPKPGHLKGAATNDE